MEKIIAIEPDGTVVYEDERGIHERPARVVPVVTPPPAPVVVNLADGVSDTEATAAGQALQKRKRGK